MNANTATIQTVPTPAAPRGLKRVAAPSDAAPATAKVSKRPTTTIQGRAVKRYLQVCRRLKMLAAAKETLETPVQSAGLKLLFKHNVSNPGGPVTSVNVIDSTGAEANVQFKDQYKTADAEVAVAMFDEVSLDPKVAALLPPAAEGQPAPLVDPNDFIHEVITAKFDNSVFLVSKDGKEEFSQERFDAFKAAIEETAKKLGITTPVLTSTTKIVPKSNFHAARWGKFPSVEAQETIQKTLIATVAVRAS